MKAFHPAGRTAISENRPGNGVFFKKKAIPDAKPRTTSGSNRGPGEVEAGKRARTKSCLRKRGGGIDGRKLLP